jgi:hypothetical protein
MLKKILIVLILINLGTGAWLFRDDFREIFKKNSQEEIIVTNKKDIENENILTEESMDVVTKEDKIVAEGNIKMAQKTNDGKILYYNQNNFLKTNSSGNEKETLSSYPFQNVKTIQCSNSGRFCLVWGDIFSVYDLENKNNEKLNSEIVDVDLNSQQDGLIYLYKDRTGYQLNTSNLFGDNWVKIKKLSGENIKISVSPDENKLVYFSQGASQEESGIFLANLVNKSDIEKIIFEDIIDADWAPSGDKILFSFYDHKVSPKRLQLGYYDLNQKKQFNLGLPTITQKCAWEEDSLVLYCAALSSVVPKEFILDDWYSGEFVSGDVFWKIDLLNSEKERLFKGKEQYPQVDSFNLFVLEKELFFIDKISGNLIKREI